MPNSEDTDYSADRIVLRETAKDRNLEQVTRKQAESDYSLVVRLPVTAETLTTACSTASQIACPAKM